MHHYMGVQLSFSLLYVWCKKEPLAQVRFFFGFVFKSGYLPWVMVAFDLFSANPHFYQELIGLAVGHSYIILKDLLPRTKGIDVLRCPKFFKKFVDQYWYKFALVQEPQDNFPRPGGDGFQQAQWG